MKAGVYGFGRMGKNHAMKYKELGHEVYVHDIRNVSSECEKCGYVFKDKLPQLLDAVDIVSVCVPNNYHLKAFQECLNYGIPALIEKPLACNVKDSRKIVKLSKENPKYKVMVGHIERFNPAVKKLKKLLSKEKIENINFIRYGPIPPLAEICGVTLDLGIHDIDLSRYLLEKEPKKVRADFFYYDNKYEHKSHVDLFFDPDITATLDLSWRSKAKVRLINTTTESEHYVVNLTTQKIGKTEEFKGMYKSYKDLLKKSSNIVDIKVEEAEPLKNELKHFINYVKTGKGPLVSVEDGLKAIEIIEYAIKSGRTGKEVKLYH